MAYWITPYHKRSAFSDPLTIEDKITIFEEQTLGWQIDIAGACINGRNKPSSPKETEGQIEHSGFAVLYILCSYFELIAKTKAGYTAEDKSAFYFRKGLLDVYPHLQQAAVSSLHDIYHAIRCGFYHAGLAYGKVYLSGDLPEAIACGAQGWISVNPHVLAPDLRYHLERYISDLQDPQNVELRQKFETRFDAMH